MMNNIKTLMLLMLLSGLILFMGQAMGGQQGLLIAFGIALLMNVGSYWFSDKIVLRMYKAEALTVTDAPGLHKMIEELSNNAGIPKPRIFLVPEEAPNAFATGRNPANAVVAVTQGLMKLLTPDEVRGVVAHEIGHIVNRDILIQSIAGVLATVVMFVANMMKFSTLFGGSNNNNQKGGGNIIALLAMVILAPLAASLIQMAISRSREYLADATAARLSKAPKDLASALNKLTNYSQQIPMHQGSEATSHMFIVHPFSGGLRGLFSTHPPAEERIRRLQEMQKNM